MTRLILTALLGITCIFGMAQPLVVNFSGAADQAPGSQVTIDVSIDDFDDLILFQFGVLWDPSVATFNSITNVTSDLPQFTEDGNIGTPENASMSLDDGEIFTSWSLASTEPFSIPDGTVIFSIVLDMVGEPCDSTLLNIGNLPPDRLIEVVDSDFNLVGAVSGGTIVSVAGDNCDGMGNPDVLTISASCESAIPDSKVCLDVTVKNFEAIETAQSGIMWDSLKLEYCGVDSFGLPGLNANLFNTTNVSAGELKFLWFDNTGSNPVTLPNDSIIFRVCFNVTGNIGEVVNVNFVDLPEPPPLLIEFSSMGSAIEYEVVSGKVIITDVPPADPFEINGGTINDACPGDIVCVPFSTENFDDIGSAQYTMVWDSDFMTYTGQQNLNTTLPITNFNFNGVEDVPGEGITKVRFSWNASSTCMIPDGSLLYEMCFEINEDAMGSSTVDLVSDPPINIEFGNCSGQALAANEYELTAGTVNRASNCNPEPTECAAIPVNVCFGETDTGGASIGANSGLTAPITVEWKNENGILISTNPDLTGQGPGTYIMCLTDVNNLTCADTFSIAENPEIVITVNTVDAACDGNGSAEIEVSGGTPDLTASISPDGNINDLPVGVYTVTVTDAANCSASLEFEIEVSDPDDISISVTTMEACEGEEGMVDISINGGCDPTCTVDGVPCEEITMLPAGSYTAIATEGNISVEEEFEISSFTFNISTDGVNPESSVDAFDGFINILVDAECENPQFSWVGPEDFGAQTMNIAGLQSGLYTVTVTCDNGCSQSMDILVPGLEDPCEVFSSLIVTDVSCFGLSGDECDGAIVGVLTSNCMDPSFSVNGDPQTNELDITGLCAGEYNIQVFDGGVFAFDTTVTVGDGAQLVANPVVTDASESLDDGTISLNISGGTAPYTVEWNQAGVEGENPTGLTPGLYNAIVTDANGCDIIVQNIRVDEPIGPLKCFTALNIITPNADGANDSFIINCAPSTNNRLQVFDRWGRLVYGATNYSNNWQGIDNDGELLDEGAYLWVLEVELDIADTRIFRGTLTVLREL